MSENNLDGYKFFKPVRKASYRKEIPSLFDSPPSIKCKGNHFYGHIQGLEAVIVFSDSDPCIVYAKTENELNIIHKYIVNFPFKGSYIFK